MSGVVQAVRGLVSRVFGVRRIVAACLPAFLLVFATFAFSVSAPQRAEAAGTCTINWGTVAYRSTNNTYVMSQTVNSAVLAACDPRFPAVDSGVASPTSGTSVGGGTWSGVTNAIDNTLTYTPPLGRIGSDSFIMYFCNDPGCSVAGRLTATVNINIAAPTLSLTSSLPGGTQGAAYSQTITASGGTSAYTFAVRSGSLPPGLSLGSVSSPNATTSAVTLSGTPTTGGTYSFVIRATDSSTGSGPAFIDQAYSLTVTSLAPTVTSVSPTSGPTAGGTAVTITGAGFSGTTAVTFGATAATGFTVNSATQITATAPAGTGTVDVRVTTAGGTSATNAADQYTYVAAPVVTSVSPGAGPTGGGTSVILTGLRFSGTTSVTFGTTAATGFTVNSASQITAVAPAGAGTVNIRVTTAGGTSPSTIANQFTYAPPPTITTQPSNAAVTNGATATFTAAASGTAPLTVQWQRNPGSGFANISGATAASYSFTATLAMSGYEYRAVFTDPGGTITTGARTLLVSPVQPSPTVVILSPGSGPTTGGQSVAITGTDFTGATSVSFGGVPAQSFTVFSATQITATAPAGTGTVDVRVTTASGTSATNAGDQYTYVAAPAVSSVSPGSGSAGGGTSVVLTGTDFTGATAVTFGATAATGYTVNSATQITATAPAGTGTVDVRVTTAGGTSATNAGDQYTYVAVPTISGITPAEGAAHASTPPASIVITGSNFSQSGNTVTIGGTPATVLSDSSTGIQVTPPARAAGGRVDIVVTTASGQSVTQANGYRYLLPPTATVTWSPDVIAGVQTTRFSVTVSNPNDVAIQGVRIGSNGANTPFFLTAFGTVCGSGTYNANSSFILTGFTLAAGASCTAASDQQATAAGAFQFVTSAPTSTGTATTAVTLTGVAATSNTITSYKTPSISSISPNFGPLAGGTSVTITGSSFNGATAVTIDGVALTNVVVVSTTSITGTVPAGASAGSKTVAVTGPGGTGSRTGLFTYIAPPAVPVILAPVDGGTSLARPTYSGTGATGSTVTVYVDGVSIGTVVASGTGGPWSLQQPSALADGSTHTVHAIASTVNGGASAASATINFTVDAVAPAAPVVTTPANGARINTANPGLSGTVEAGSTVYIYVDSALIGTHPGSATGGGTWSYASPTLANGSHTVRATASDPAGNLSSSSATNTFIVDTVAPAVPVIASPTAGATVGSTTPAYSGSAEADAIITVRVDGAVIGTTTATGGAWSLLQPAALGDGAHSVTATATDLAGNSSAASAATGFNVDAVAPAMPTVTTPASGANTRDNTPTFTGTAEAGATVRITSAAVQATVVADGSGAWTATLPVQADAQYTYAVTATDAAGNVSSPSNVVVRVDTVAPGTPTLTAPLDNGPALSTTPTFTGTGEPNSVISLRFNGNNAVSGIFSDSTGNWSFTYPQGLSLPSGVYVATVTNEDFSGNVSPESAGRTFTVDRTAPVVLSSAPEFQDVAQIPTKVFLVTFNEAVGAATTADFTLTTTGSVTGTISSVAISGAEVRVTVTGLAGEGAVRVNIVAGNGIKDALGNGGGVNSTTTAAFAAGTTHTVDTVNPAVPILTAPLNGAIVTTATPTVSGTGEAAATITLYLDNTYFGQTTAGSTGAFSFALTSQDDGSHRLQLSANDTSGNGSGLGPVTTFTIDTTAPATPVILAPAEGSTGASRSVVLSGTSEGNATVLIVLDGANQSVMADNGGEWSYTAGNLTDGAHSFTAQARDAAGFTSSLSAARSFTVDATAPVAPTVSAPVNGSVTADNTPTISGSAEADVTVTVSIDGAAAGTATADGSGAWTLTAAGLADGSHTVSATAADTAGNVSPASAVISFTVDARAPIAPVISTPVTGSTSADTTPTVSGAAEAGSTVTISIDGASAGTATTNGSGAWSFTAAALADGSHTVSATATDAVGNVSPASASVSFTVDATAPTAPILSTPVIGSTTADNTPTVSGAAEAGATVTVSIDGASAGTATASGSGVWSFTAAVLADGSHTVSATATDAVGNLSPASTVISFSVDATAPTAPILSTPVIGSTTADNTPTVSGAAEAGSTVTISIDGASAGTATSNGAGDWTFTAAALADGSHTVSATATDAVGNVSPASAVITFTVDATAPTAPTLSTPVNGSTMADNTPTIAGAAEAGSTVTISIDGASAGTATANGSGVWSFTAAVLADGSHTVSATATDAVGNLSPASTVISFTVDATAPTAPTVSAPANGSTTSDNTPTIAGSAEANATVTVSIDGAAAGTASANGSGAWSFIAAALADGSHTVSATATDAVGNVSQASTAIGFTVDATAPRPPTLTTPVNGSTTAGNTPTIAGTAEADATVAVSIDGGAVGAATANGSGVWTFTAQALADGSHTVSATATDAVGNLSPASTTTSFTIDTTAPLAPVILTPEDGSVTDDGTPMISGTAEAGATVRLSINGATPIVVAVSGGAWTYTPTSNLPAGQNTLSAITIDPVDNASPASTTVRFTYSPVTITTPTLPSGQVGVAYAATIQASGGTGPYGFGVTAGALPDGLALSGSGALSGTPSASGTYLLTVTATDANSLSTSQTYSIEVARPADPLVTDVDDVVVTVTPGGAGDPTVIDLSGAVQNAVRIEVVTPPAHGVATVTGFEVTYTPEAGYFGQDSFTYRAVGFDDGGVSAPAKDGSPSSGVSQPATVSIIIASPTLSLTGGAQPSGQIGAVYSQVLSTSGGTAPYSYAVTGGALPTGITLATDGTLSGSPTAGGPFSFTVTATDSSTGTGPFSVSAVHELTIDAPALTVTPSALPSATTAQAYSQSFSTTGGVAPYSYAVTAGALPTGLTLSASGTLSGTPTQGGIFNFTVSATDASTGAGPYTASQPVTLTVTASAISVTPASLTSGTRGTPYTATVAASGGVAPYSYTIASGALPAGLTLSTTGQISGTPTVVGTFAFQVRATDSATGAGPYAGTANVSLTIASATLTVTPTTLPDGLAGVSWSEQLQASGGRGGYSFAVTAGVLPNGLTLTPAGLLSGKPTTAGTFAFTVTATDGFGNTGFAPLSVTIIGRPDPSADPDVRGLNSAQAEAARRMVTTQLGNFGRRLEQLHRGGEGQAGVAMNLTVDGSAFTPLDEGRATMGELATARGREDARGPDLSGREELNRMVWGDRAGAEAPGGRSPAALRQNGLNAGQTGGSGSGADGASGPRVWAGGAISLGERDATTRTAEMSITTSGISVGVDLSLADNLDLGVGVGFGQENTDVGAEGSRMEADSRLAVAYGSWRPSDDVFIDGILGYGELGFDTHRRTPVDQSIVFGQRDGTALFGSLSAGLDRVAGPSRWLGYGRVEVLNADLDAFVETGSPVWALSYEARRVESLQGALGLRYEQELLRGYDRWTPGVRVEWTHEFGDSGAQALRYADWLDGPGYAIGQEGWQRSRFNLGLSLGWRARDGWSWTGEYNGAFSNGEAMNGLRIKGSKAF